MATIKVIEEANEVYWSSTFQGKVDVDGQEIDFRFAEDSNGAELYILTEDGWEGADLENENYNALYDACMDSSPNHWDDEFDTDEDLI